MDNVILKLILAFVTGGFLLGQVMSYLNHRRRKLPAPPGLEDVFDKEKYLKYRNYKRDAFRSDMLEHWAAFILMMALLLGGFALIDELVIKISGNKLLQSLLFLGIAGLISDLIATPFNVYDTFVLEQKYGFNTTTPRIWISDKLKSYLIAAVAGGGIMAFLILLYNWLGSSFWWLAWIAVTLVSVFFTLFYSTLIVPLFNKQTPLPDGPLRDKLNELARETGFAVQDIFIIDGSKRSNRANAYFSGFGSKRRIVLYDTLIKTMNVDSIAAVLAHEIGHYREKHVVYGLVRSVLQTGFILFLFSRIVNSSAVYEALGASGPGFHLGLVVFVLLYSPVSLVLSVIGNYISRKNEFEADAFAARYSDGKALARALRKLASDNLSDLTPHPLYVWFEYSHPPLADRLARLE